VPAEVDTNPASQGEQVNDLVSLNVENPAGQAEQFDWPVFS
jgi:deoxyribodipyrimidine photolyase-like uncharacterized protein